MRFTLIILCILGFSCTRTKNPNTTTFITKSELDTVSKYEFQSYDDKYVHIDTITKAEFEKYSRSDYFANIDTTIKIAKIKTRLDLPIENGKLVSYTDSLKTECDELIGQNKYVGIVKGINHYLISRSIGHDSYDYFLINKANGKEYSILDKPYISPNLKYLFTFSDYLEFEIKTTGFQLWIIKGQKLNLIDNVKLDKWQIREIKWVTDNQIAIHIDYGDNRNKYGMIKIK